MQITPTCCLNWVESTSLGQPWCSIFTPASPNSMCVARGMRRHKLVHNTSAILLRHPYIDVDNSHPPHPSLLRSVSHAHSQIIVILPSLVVPSQPPWSCPHTVHCTMLHHMHLCLSLGFGGRTSLHWGLSELSMEPPLNRYGYYVSS